MSLKSYQLALAAIVASPQKGKAYAADPALLEAEFELTPAERDRLLYMLQQKGMRINYMLYQTNRMTPLSIFMPYTFKVLRPQLLGIVQQFWKVYPKTAFQFKEEIVLFSDFLKEKIDRDGLDAPFLRDVIRLEDGLNDIRFGMQPPAAPGIFSLHPAVRVLRTTVDPQLLAEAMVTYDHTAAAPLIPPAGGPFLMRYITRLELFPVTAALAAALEQGNLPEESMPQDLVDQGLVLCGALQ
ncbi:hypothetical protein [Taibaiella chishuiensis]|uniref:Uncharacterized protein n=1 Tax=Taibaiella chishuiensis TaxID=1434707 RepID=A0A2P8D5T1_9BACT|nr:hypothetical protein [Taibaiella chishuiensis]PSK92580.1 hypothetical protein B0I18_103157 [Taibaiella chishuiensis]